MPSGAVLAKSISVLLYVLFVFFLFQCWGTGFPFLLLQYINAPQVRDHPVEARVSFWTGRMTANPIHQWIVGAIRPVAWGTKCLVRQNLLDAGAGAAGLSLFWDKNRKRRSTDRSRWWITGWTPIGGQSWHKAPPTPVSLLG